MNDTINQGGRPPRSDGPKLSYVDLDKLLVEGEIIKADDGSEKRVWPTQRELAKRFSVAPSLIGAYSSKHHCIKRKEAFQASQRLKSAFAAAVPTRLEKPETDEKGINETTVETASPDNPETPDALQNNVIAMHTRKGGRPFKADAPRIPYEELDRLLVFGEIQVLENGSTTTVYPTYRELAKRYGVAHSIIANYAQRHNCLQRREETARRIAVRTEEKIINIRSEAIAVGQTRLVQMIDEFLLGFEKALQEGRVRYDNPTDVNTMARLKAFIQGEAKPHQEIPKELFLENLQKRYERVMRDRQNAIPEMSGAVVSSRLTDSRQQQDKETDVDPPTRVFSNAAQEANMSEEFLRDVCELVESAREFTMTHKPQDGDTTLHSRLLRVVARVEDGLPKRDLLETSSQLGASQEENS